MKINVLAGLSCRLSDVTKTHHCDYVHLQKNCVNNNIKFTGDLQELIPVDVHNKLMYSQ